MEEKYSEALKHVERHYTIDFFEKYVINSDHHEKELYSLIRNLTLNQFSRFDVWRFLL